MPPQYFFSYRRSQLRAYRFPDIEFAPRDFSDDALKDSPRFDVEQPLAVSWEHTATHPEYLLDQTFNQGH